MQPDAVIFDWGGTLTRWHDIDFHAESLALAHAVVESEHATSTSTPRRCTAPTRRSGAAAATTSRARPWPTCSPRRGSSTTRSCSSHYREFWEPHTATDPQVAPLFPTLRDRGIKVGVLSNTIWPRAVARGLLRAATGCST